jgi:alpha-mannosidase
MKKQVIAYLHTHWDREWYREYEVFRMRLLRVFDNILYMLDNNKIPCFYFDGQVSALLDYLEMRPEKENFIRMLIRTKKLFIGPFYCLIDEFLTDRQCFEKNLELGMKTAIDFGCTDFIGYLADTFGHSQNIPDMLREFGIDKAMVWRGCGDFPAEFKWCGMDTVNLVRGYFNDVFSINCSIEEKASILKKNLDLIAEKSGLYVLLPIGADHLGIPFDIEDQIAAVNEILSKDYEITLGSPFDYFKNVSTDFDKFKFDGELRDNSKTFTLQGCYSSRLDIKRLNIETSHKLDLANRYVRFCKAESKYSRIIDYAYKMLLQNQAHDSICGCSTDDVHSENIIRYKKIMQIANTIIDELKFETNFEEKMVLNLSDKNYTGSLEFSSAKEHKEFEKLYSKKGFDKKLLTDINRIPITEDYIDINQYLVNVENLEPDQIEFIMPEVGETDLYISDKLIKNDKIKLEINNGEILINDTPFSLVDWIDLGDSYNHGPKIDDNGYKFNFSRSRVILNKKNRVGLKIDFEGARDIVSLVVTLDKGADFLKFEFNWDNSQKNHLLEVCFSLKENIKQVYSEDMNLLIKREFDSGYNIREHLPSEIGIEAKTNTAPMQRGLIIDESENNIGVITKGLTQYEIFENKLYIPILRATGVISNPLNTARTTPAGPPIETLDLQMLGQNQAELYVFFGNQNTFNNVMNRVYNYIIT